MSRQEEIKQLIAEREALVTPLLSEIGKLRAEAKRLTLAESGITTGCHVWDNAGREYIVTKARKFSQHFHLTGKLILKNGSPAKRASHIGILGHSVYAKPEALRHTNAGEVAG